jgi:hypothetical protein
MQGYFYIQRHSCSRVRQDNAHVRQQPGTVIDRRVSRKLLDVVFMFVFPRQNDQRNAVLVVSERGFLRQSS